MSTLEAILEPVLHSPQIHRAIECSQEKVEQEKSPAGQYLISALPPLVSLRKKPIWISLKN